MIGNYAGGPCGYTGPIDGFSVYGNVTYQQGCEDVACADDSLIASAMEAAKEADATVLMVGLNLSVEAEGLDRTDLLLPGYQTQLIGNVSQASKGPVILVVMSAGGVDITFAKNDGNVKAILWAGYPGGKGGRANADVVFGQYNPGGRLPLTWYEAQYVNAVPMTSMPLRPDDESGYPGRTQKFFNGSTVYPFGYGLSYTQFNYTVNSAKDNLQININNLQSPRDLNYKNNDTKPSFPAASVYDLPCDQKFEFEIVVQNVGDRDGTEVVIVYSQSPQDIVGVPIKKVVGFKRVFVAADSQQLVTFSFDVCKSFSIVDYNAYKLLPSGTHTILIGDAGVSFPINVNFSS